MLSKQTYCDEMPSLFVRDEVVPNESPGLPTDNLHPTWRIWEWDLQGPVLELSV